jgi:hypothetical protein
MSTPDVASAADRPPSQTELRRQVAHRQEECLAARSGRSQRASVGAPSPFMGEAPIDTGIMAAARVRTENPRNETGPPPELTVAVTEAVPGPNHDQTTSSGTRTPLIRGAGAPIKLPPTDNCTVTAAVTPPRATTGTGLEREFMERVVAWPGPDRPGNINLHYPSNDPKFKSMPGKPFTNVNDFMSYVDFAVRTFDAVYFCLSTQSQAQTYKNGKPGAVRRAENAVALKSIWLDVDVKNDPKHYKTLHEALEALSSFRLAANLPAPSALVFSRNGIHVYWISEKALTVQEWKPYAEGLR